MARKVFLLLGFFVVFAAESAYFARQCAAGILRLRGERAFFRNDHTGAWTFYRRALSLGGERETLENDLAELLLFGLDQTWAGVRIRTALPSEDAVRAGLDFVARRIRETPYKAYEWSLASDVYFHEARLHRQNTSLDLSMLTEDPLDILLPEERLGLAALETAARLEPTNYIYQDLLTEKFLELGSVSRAAVYCRRSVASLPVLSEHSFLGRPDLAPELLEAAIGGVEDSRLQDSMIPRATVESAAGDFLWRNGQTQRSLDFLKRAVSLAPDLFEAQYGLGLAAYTLGDYDEALRHLEEASRIQPDNPTPNVHMGLSYTALGDLPAAIDQFRSAREKDARGLWYFLLLGDALEKSGQIREAERQFVAGANVNPDSSEAWAALLTFYTRHRDLRPATEACSRLRVLSPAETRYKEQCVTLGLETR
ncbi:MAG TPA: tetratricopeptide repeat protein [Candidatus Dormibacteraeota bacterium]|nr:tetratricopeptide repeat protein [Candidatus Dormibacteraeota bacterium]